MARAQLGADDLARAMIKNEGLAGKLRVTDKPLTAADVARLRRGG